MVAKKGKSYALTNIGIIKKNIHDQTAKTLRCIEANRDFFLGHDLSSIPTGFQMALGFVCDGREIIEKDPVKPFHLQEIIIPILAKAGSFLVATSAIIPEHQLAAANAVREGASMKVVTSERIVQELRLKSNALKDHSLRDRFEVYRSNNFNLHLIITDSHLFMALPRLDGSFDLENIIISRDPQALQWASLLFYHFQSGAQKIDLATF
jgi:predicted transcriptional regulator